MQAWPLERKILVTQAKILEWYHHYSGNVAVSFSGGKDSTVLLDLVRRAFPDVPAVFVDTGLEYPEIREFVRTIPNVTWLRPEMPFSKVLTIYGYPIISKDVAKRIYYARQGSPWALCHLNGLNADGTPSKFNERYMKWRVLLDAPFLISDKCCSVMKERPLHQYARENKRYMIVGTMASESVRRQSSYLKTGCNAYNKRDPTSQPLSFWTEQDILAYLKMTGILYASVYGEVVEKNGKLTTTGVKRSGCMFCMNGKLHRRNLLQIIVGGFGSGKTRFLAKPNLMLANASFIVTDPKGEMLRAVGNLFLEEGYVLRVFDLIDPSKSDCYNPFCYIRKDADVFKLIDNFIKNTTPKSSKTNDPFWEKSETALDAALMLYLLHEAPPEDQNMETILYMIENGGAKEEDDDYQSPLDLLFEALEEEQPDHIAVRQYHIFKQAAGKTAKSILVSAAVRLASFTLPEIQRITASDDMELGKLGERKQAIFCIIPDSNDASLNFLVGMLYTQAFQELYYQADKVHQGALPVPVRLMFDEFANVALPDGYARLQATMRSRNIMSTIILQNISQLKALFKDDWEGIIGNADSFIYLGGNEQSTHKYISELLGKETIDTRTSSQSKGRNGSFSQNFQQTGRELMTPDEVRRLDNKNAIVLIRGEKPVIDEKYDILKHPNIHRTEDGGAPPYLHTPLRAFAADDLSFPVENIDDIEILEEST